MSSQISETVATVLDIKFNWIQKTLSNPYREHFPSYTEGLVRGEPGGFVLSPEYARSAEQLRNFQLKSDDIWIVTFPKCGTTWTQELLWMIVNNCDEEGAKQPLFLRSPFLEFPYLTPASSDDSTTAVNKMVTLEMIEKMPSTRIIKTHLPLYLLSPKLLETCKVVYVVRNPKDVIVSYFHHHKLFKIQTYTGSFEQFAEYFMNDELFYSPFFPHALEAWAQRNHPNMLFMFYEDMKKNLKGQIERVADFLGKKLSEEQLSKLTAHLQFENFSKNDAVNFEPTRSLGFLSSEGKFVRKGETGDWKNHFSPELNRRVDLWMKKNLAGSDLKFITELRSI